MAVQRSVRLRRWSLALGTSIAAMGVASSAQAQCSPDPVTSFNTTTCTGTDNDGLIADAFAARVLVAEGATVRGGFLAPIDTRSQSATFTINGTVDGESRMGFLVSNGQPYLAPCDPYAGAAVIVCPPGLQTVYPSASATVTVGAAGRLTGAQGLVSRRLSSNGSGGITVDITNEGTIQGTNGTAIRDASGVLTISNRAGGTIRGVGTAIDTDGALRLVNAGTIEGSVVARTAASGTGSVDTLAGTIRGDLTLGASDDTLAARYDAGQVVTGVTGAINGGAGVDTLDLRVTGDVRFATLPLPTGFERLGLTMSGDATIAIGTAGGTINGLLALRGAGTVTTDGVLAGTGEVVGDSFDIGTGSGRPTFVNAGTIRASAGGANTYAVRMNVARRFQNDGLVESGGNGVSFNAQGRFANNGTIVAAGTAVEFSGGSFANAGTIRSTAGIGAVMSGSVGSNWTNSGTIEGAVAGVQLRSNLINTGTITSPALAVALSFYGVLDNRAGGRVIGNVGALSPNDTTFNAVVANAGRIDGDVRLSGRQVAGFGGGNRYFALPGGVLNGNLTLNGSEQLVTEAVNDGPGAFAGIAGTVTATDALLRYRVRGDLTTAATARAGFAEIGYDLYDDAALTLTGIATPLVLAGKGSVDLTGDLTATTRPVISITRILVAPGETVPAADADGVSITSRGTLTLERNDASQPGAYAAVAIDRGHSFTNAGTIVARDRAAPGFGMIAAISGGVGGTVVNDGTITLDGAMGISDAARVTNNGTIVQAAGGRAARGVSAWSGLDLTNNGTIEVEGYAVGGANGVTLVNAGRIASTGGAAIGGDYAGYVTVTNRAGATIAGNGTAIHAAGGTVTNAGTITGSVDLGYSSFGGRAFGPGTYVAQGGTIAGDLRFGDGNDTLIVYDDATGVTGAIDGGQGTDSYVHARTTSGNVTLGSALPTGFETEGVRALGSDTVVTLRADAPVTDGLRLSGDGAFVNTADIDGTVTNGVDSFIWSPVPQDTLAAFTNQARLGDGFTGTVRRFVNTDTGSIVARTAMSDAVRINQGDAIDFVNAGSIARGEGASAVSLYSAQRVTADNSGRIAGGFAVSAQSGFFASGDAPALSVSLTNTGTITGDDARPTLAASVIDYVGGSGTLTIDNAGTIETDATGRAAAYLEMSQRRIAPLPGSTQQLQLTNSGMIRANGGGATGTYIDGFTGEERSYVDRASAIVVETDEGITATIVNTATGTLEATGDYSTTVAINRGTLDLANAGTIRGGASFSVDGFTYAGAIQADGGDDRIVNTGTIVGSVALGDGNDRVENFGRIEGDVFLGAGDDTFLHRAAATLTGTVDAGAGDDGLVIDATGGGTVRADRFVSFERFSQIGAGAVDYVGAFRSATIGVSGGTVTVAAGETLSSAGATTITGSDAAETVDNAGTIGGSIALGAGGDRVVNAGTIGGAVLLGDGDDTFVERAGSSVAGGVDGGAGIDLYTVALTGDRSGIGARSGFEQLAVTGNGTLALTLDQGFDGVSLAGTALALTLNGNAVGAVTGSDAGETLAIDGDVAQVALGGGDDVLALGTARAAGRYAGGAGSDTLRFTATGPVVLAGTATGFETLALAGSSLTVAGTLGAAGERVALGDGAQTLVVADGGTVAAAIDLGGGDDVLALDAARAAGRFTGGAGSDMLRFTATGPVTFAGDASGFEQVALAGDTLTVTGTLGAAGDSVAFGAGAQTLVVADGGTLAGAVDLGAGNDTFRLSPTGTLAGTVAGGAGDDGATLVLAGARTLAAGTLTGFETLATEGNGTLTLTGAQGYDRVAAGTDLTIAGGATLAARTLAFSGADNRLVIAGGFAGAVDGGAGSDTIAVSGAVSGGSAAAPVAFASIANVEAFGMSGGYATIAGNAAPGAMDLTGGRLVGLAGSTINASRINVAQGATFGSAGTVNANLTVAGILSPGASPGTMTVNGNVALAGGSRALFELTPTVSDKLVVNGALSIASGSTLELASSGTLRPGASYDLITASGGITGGFTTVTKPADLFGFVVQRADRIQLLGQFLTDARFAPQVARSVAYANATLAVQPATSTLFASLPALVDASGASNARAFAQLTPEPYASATQLGVDHALTLAQAARGPAFATVREDAGLFTFAQTVGQWHTLRDDAGQDDAGQGSAAARARSYGFLGGLGYGDGGWSVGAFGGYLNGRQQIGALGARTRADGVVAGVHGRYGSDAGWGFSASVLYDGGQARTDRALPGARGASARYDLHSWVSDVAAHYGLDVGDGWSLRPRVGVTYIRTTRAGVAEGGGSAFALTVARDRHVAGFADAGVTLARSDASDAPFRPFVTLGARYQIEGRRVDALAGYAGGGLGLSAAGADRAELVGTAAGGVAYRLPGGLDLFATASAQTGRDDHQETIATGVRLRF